MTFMIPIDEADDRLFEAIAQRVEGRQPLLIPIGEIECPPEDPVGRDAWATPQWLVNNCARRFTGGAFDLDACASALNHKADRFFTVDDNGLAQSWANVDGSPARVWCNPPYSQLGIWIDAALDQVRAFAAVTIVLLVPNRTDSEWYRTLLAHQRTYPWSIEIEALRGRVPFEPPPGVVDKNGNNEGSIIVVIRRAFPPLPEMVAGKG